jgi:hypothetical protein
VAARWYRGPGGDQRLWLDRDDIELMMEDELRGANLLPAAANPAVDIEVFLERHLKVSLDQHADLPADVLGLTEFFPGKTPRVAINKDLTGSAIDEDESPLGLRGRWRATLAHEASHVFIHRPLFELPPEQGRLFGDSPEPAQEGQRLMRCQKRSVLYRGTSSDWREVQANQGMAALLMPRSVFLAVATFLQGANGPSMPGSADARRLVVDLASRFEVSRQAADIRLSTLGVLGPAGQRALAQ